MKTIPTLSFIMRYRFLFLIFFLPLISIGQTFEWANFHQGYGQTLIGGFINDERGNQYIGVNFEDTLDVDGTKYSSPPSSHDRVIILKQDKDSNVLWSHPILSSSYIEISCVSFNSLGQVIVIAQANAGTITFPGGSTLTTTSYGAFIATFSPSGTYVKSRKLFEATNSINTLFSRNDKADNLYFVYQTFGDTKIFDSVGTTTINWVSGQNYIVLKFAKSGALFKWNKRFSSSFFFNDLSVDKQFNVYLCGQVYSQFTFASRSSGYLGNGSYGSGVTLAFDSSGIERNFFMLRPLSGNNAWISNVAPYDTGSVFISGFIKGDSAQLGQNWYGPKHDSVYHFVAKCSISGKVSWIKMADLPNASIFSGSFGSSFMTTYMDSFIYVCIFQTQVWPASYDNTTVSGTGDEMILKLDYLGNVLWSFKIPAYLVGLGTDSAKGFYFGGNYEGTINLGPFQSTAVGAFTDIFIAKTTDYAIFRGNIYAGPYCAGDTISVPYTKLGIYDTANYFIAELSDEDGNFLGGQRELGRIKSQDSGTIKGLLPLFSVASSAKYRIRVRSTVPQVQSFYKFDTLRLLVYSKDTANAGPDKIICKGDTITLKTFGGTKWHWTPGQWLKDSLFWKTEAVPDSTVEYAVYISDSSGCGVTDTDKVMISVRPELKMNATKVDTGLCIGSSLILGYNIPAGVTGYIYAWSPSSGLDDSTKLRPIATPLVNTVYTLMAIDTSSGCNCKRSDTINVTINKKPKTGFKYVRTCNNDTASFTDTSVTFNSSLVNWKWMFGDGDSSVVKDPSHIYNSPGTYNVKLEVTSSKGCIDSITKQVIIYPAPMIAFNTSDICESDTAVFINTSSIMQGSITSVLWDFGDGTTSTQSSPKHKYNNDSTYTITLTAFSDKGCVNSLSKNLIVNPYPVAGLLSKVICFHDTAHFTDDLSLGNITGWLWDFGDTTSTSLLKSPSHFYKYPGTYPLKLIVYTNQCSDTITKSVIVLPSPIADFNATNACKGQQNIFTDLSIISSGSISGHSWDFGDGNTSLLSSPVHTYADTGAYKVKLKVTGSSGCIDSITKTINVWNLALPGFTSSIACDKHTVTFNDTSAISYGSINSYRWYFGDGDSSLIQNPIHVYNTTGIFTVKLSLMSDKGCLSTLSKLVNVTVAPLKLDTIKDDTLCAGQPYLLTAKASGSDSSDYLFTLYLNNTLTGQNHSGDFLITNSALSPISDFKLIVTDSCLGADSLSYIINIADSLKIITYSNDTTVCKGTPLTLFANAKGGKGIYQYSLKKNGIVLQTNTSGSFNVIVGSKDIYTIVVGDECLPNGDSILINIQIFDTLQFTNKQPDIYLCNDESLNLKSTTNIGSGTVKYTWYDSSGTILANTDTLQFVPLTSTKIILKATDACVAIYDTFMVYLFAKVNDTILIADPQNGCLPLKVNFESPTLHHNNNEPYEAMWDFGDGITLVQNFNNSNSNIKSNHTYLSAGVYNVELRIKFKNSTNICNIFHTLVEALQVPQITLNVISEKITSPKKQCIAFVSTTDADSVVIDWGDGFTDNFSGTNLNLFNQFHDYDDTGHYTIKAIAYNKKSCYADVSTKIIHSDTFTCYIPNAFSPNKDATNEVFAPVLSFAKSYTMVIYNRWGEEIYNFNSATNCPGCPKGWDGEDNNSGVYIYQIRVTDNDNQKHTFKGTMILLR